MRFQRVRLSTYNTTPEENGSVHVEAKINFGGLSWPEFMANLITPAASAIFAKMIPEPPPVMVDGKINPAFIEFRKRYYETTPSKPVKAAKRKSRR